MSARTCRASSSLASKEHGQKDDGACLFHALLAATLLQSFVLLSAVTTMLGLRGMLLDFLEQHAKDRCSSSGNTWTQCMAKERRFPGAKSMTAYLNVMRSDWTEWGGQLEIAAFSQSENMDVWLWAPVGRRPKPNEVRRLKLQRGTCFIQTQPAWQVGTRLLHLQLRRTAYPCLSLSAPWCRIHSPTESPTLAEARKVVAARHRARVKPARRPSRYETNRAKSARPQPTAAATVAAGKKRKARVSQLEAARAGKKQKKDRECASDRRSKRSRSHEDGSRGFKRR